ncbi:hypothetical protein EV215_0890 [Hypnocyclicus thermotrophus]|uniref:SHOCT-like domain-containing protein n=1 Tax=Hypnocyclicus thermotrophus TaxID=1627895 RepID=A0AA46DZ60_9FUSO|nr:SHOCT domain-containing protein [Hypnocyclicus thermotrophus]TDT71514.1 hypothetical protein EV215_0890 [Hypnocyclicus thermotrophus]
MNVTKIDGNYRLSSKVKKKSNEQLQREYDYIRADQITKRMFEKGLITEDELNKITELNRKYFSPSLVEIMPCNR